MNSAMLLKRVVGLSVFALIWAATLDAASGLVEAVKKNDVAAVHTLLQQGTDVNIPEPDGMTALHWAVQANETAIVELLIRSRANVTATTRYGVTPLSLAC
ncbi:MAG: hypothetical protein DMF58_20345, partial [Acidobacteria bacterium]